MVYEKDTLKVTVVGSSTMGTALAHVVACAGHTCTLLTHDAQVMETINLAHRHPVFFSGLNLHPQVRASITLEDCIPEADLIIMAVPSYEMRSMARKIGHLIHASHSVLSVTKGFEPVTHQLMSVVLSQELKTNHIGTLCGPNITLDLVKNLPTALMVASTSVQLCEHSQQGFSSPSIKILTSADIHSYEYVSALKNIIALEVGVVTGLGLGDNFRALVMAKGMAEISQLMATMDLNSQAFYSLAGLSDIFLTCSSHFAHNYAIGVQLGEGALLADLLAMLKAKGETAEGIESLKAGLGLIQQYNCSAPLLEATYALIYGEVIGLDKGAFLSAAF